MDIVKKIKNLNLLAFQEGLVNFTSKDKEAKELAEKRYLEKCVSCIHFKKEPISFLQIEDEDIPELSNMQCGECGCIASYKLRQSKKLCKLW